MDTIFNLESFDIFQKVTQDLLTSLYYLEQSPYTMIDFDTFEKAKQEMRTLISECNFDIKTVTDQIVNKGWHHENIDFFNNLLKENWSDLLKSALNHFSSTHGETITNFDWLVKMVLGISELKTLQYPLLQLILCTVNKTGQQKRIMYDINKDMLSKMINALENI